MGSLGRYQNPANGRPASKLPKTNLLEDTAKMKSSPTIRRHQLGLSLDGPHSQNKKTHRYSLTAADYVSSSIIIAALGLIILLAALSN